MYGKFCILFDSASNSTPWTTPGGDYSTSTANLIYEQSFESGIEDLEVKYTKALIANDYLAAEKIVAEMEDIDKPTYIEYAGMLSEDKVKGKFNDLEVEAELYELLYFNKLFLIIIILNY